MISQHEHRILFNGHHHCFAKDGVGGLVFAAAHCPICALERANQMIPEARTYRRALVKANAALVRAAAILMRPVASLTPPDPELLATRMAVLHVQDELAATLSPTAASELSVKMVKTHELKCWPLYFDAILDGRKRFELRYDDRAFRVGDHLLLKEWDPESARYTGRAIRVAVTFVSYWTPGHRPTAGLNPPWVAMSIKPIAPFTGGGGAD